MRRGGEEGGRGGRMRRGEGGEEEREACLATDYVLPYSILCAYCKPMIVASPRWRVAADHPQLPPAASRHRSAIRWPQVLAHCLIARDCCPRVPRISVLVTPLVVE